MSISTGEFNSFVDFSRARIGSGEEVLTLDDLVVEWESQQHRDEINAAIAEGLEDADAGRHRPANEAMADLKQKHGLPSQ